MGDKERIFGVFSRKQVSKIGTGTTTRKMIREEYWYVEQTGEETFTAQRLNPNFIPTGPIKELTLIDLLENFSPEPEFYIANVQPKMREVQKLVARGERHRSRGEHFSAEMEYGNALGIDEENIRANFGIGLCYLQRDETTKANDIFERLLNLEAAFQPEHKHLFNDFGINLRKAGMLDQAVVYYKRALELQEEDEHLHYNIARAYYARGEHEMAAEHLTRSLAINPEFPEALQFMKFLRDKGLIEEQ